MEHIITLPFLGTMRIYMAVILFMLIIIIWPHIKMPIVYFIGRMKKLKVSAVEVELEAESKALKTDISEMDKNSAALAARIGKNANDLVELRKRIDSLEKLMVDISLDQKKHMVFNEELPPEDRMYAGLHYISLGGNHGTKKVVIKMCTNNAEFYRMAVKVSPHLAVDELKSLL